MADQVSLGELARRTHYSKGYLSKVEMGLRPLSQDVARQCDGALGLRGALIAATRRSQAQPTPEAGVPHEENGQRWVLQMDSDGSVWFQPLDRRSALLGAGSLLAFPVSGAAPLRRMHAETAVQIFADQFAQLRQLGQQMPPEFVLPMLISQVSALQRIGRESHGRTRSASFTLGARCAEYAGWMAQEAGQNPAALWWTDLAVRLAAEGGDTELAAYSLVRRALIALYSGDALETIELARRAQRHADASAWARRPARGAGPRPQRRGVRLLPDARGSRRPARR